MTTRTEIYPADLYVLLEREFKRRRPADCPACYIQFPFRVDRHDPAAPNWELILPADCPNGCGTVIEELVQQYSAMYDLGDDRRGA
jgi:hypothetical protein